MQRSRCLIVALTLIVKCKSSYAHVLIDSLSFDIKKSKHVFYNSLITDHLDRRFIRKLPMDMSIIVDLFQVNNAH